MYFCDSSSGIPDLTLTAASRVSEQFLICENGFEWLDDQNDPVGRRKMRVMWLGQFCPCYRNRNTYVSDLFLQPPASSSAGQEAECDLPHTPDAAHLFFLHLWPRKGSSVAAALIYYSTYTERLWKPGLTEGKWMNMHIYGQQGQVSRRLHNHRSLKKVEKG